MNNPTKEILLKAAEAGVKEFRDDPMTQTVAILIWRQGLKSVTLAKNEAEEFAAKDLHLVTRIDPASGDLTISLDTIEASTLDVIRKLKDAGVAPTIEPLLDEILSEARKWRRQ